MSNRSIIFVSALILTACSPSEDDVEAAVKRHWPQEQKAAIEEADFYREHAAGFQQGEQVRKEVERSLGKAVGSDSDAAAIIDESNQKAKNAEWISQSSVNHVTNVRCAEASSLSGHNCEMQLELMGKDGQSKQVNAAWRFDEVNGQLSVVDSVRGQ